MSSFSISIPTYSRKKYLLETINEYNKQWDGLKINISDNSEDFETRDAISGVGLNVNYSRNNCNIGIDLNILRSVEIADTDYVWICGDDDLPFDNAVVKVLGYLEKYPSVDFFIVNSSANDINMSCFKENLTGIMHDEMFSCPNEALKKIGWYTTFVGAFVVKKSVWDSIDAQKYVGTYFVHVGKLFEALAKGSKVFFISEPLVRYRTGNASWNDRNLQIQFSYWPFTINSLPESYSRESKLVAIKNVTNRFVNFAGLVRSRASGALTYKSFYENIFPFAKNGFEYYRYRLFFIAIMLVLVPRFIVKTIVDLRDRLKK